MQSTSSASDFRLRAREALCYGDFQERASQTFPHGIFSKQRTELVRPKSILTAILHLISILMLLGAVSVSGYAQSGDFKVYVTLPNSNSVAVIDGLTNSVVNTIAVPPGSGTAPFSVALTPDARFAYVLNGQGCNDGATFRYNAGANSAQGIVWVFDTVTNNSVATIPVGLCPQEIAVTPDGAHAYVTNFGDNTLSVIDISSNAVTETISLPDTPDGLAITPDSSRVYVATTSSVSVISTATNAIVANIPPPIPSCAVVSEVAVNPDGQQVYVTDNGCNSAFTISTQTNSVVFSFPEQSLDTPWGLAITPDGSQVYIASHTGVFDPANGVDGETFVIDTSTHAFVAHPMCRFDFTSPSACATSAISLPIFVEITRDGKEAFFSANSVTPVAGEIMVFDITNNISTASVLFSTVPAGIAISPANNTPAGTNVVVQPIDRVTKTSPVTLTFADVTQAGFTSLVTTPNGAAPPAGFQAGSPAINYNLATTAQFAGSINTCINYSGINFGSAPPALFEFENGAWINVTSLQDTQRVCGNVAFLAPFALFEPLNASPASTTTLSISPNPSALGQAVTLTATVTAAAGNPSGTVTFIDGASTLGSSSLNSSHQAVLTISSLTGGTHSISAAYQGDSNFSASASSPVTQTVTFLLTPTTTTLSSSANPSAYTQTITLTAAVSASSAGMTGIVSFMRGATSLGQANLLAGVASIPVNLGPAGTYSFTAVYAGDSNFSSSTSLPLTEVVNKRSTTCSVTIQDASNPNLTTPAPFDDANIDVHVSAQIPIGQITGTTDVYDNNVMLSQPIGFSNAENAIGLSQFTPGSHIYSGIYSGDANNNPAQCTFALTVNKANTVTTLTSSPNPAAAGQTVVFTAVVGSSTGHLPNGSVTFSDGGTSLAVAPLNGSGMASYNTSSFSAGVHTITASYGGDQSFNASTSHLTQTIIASAGGGGGGSGACGCTKTGTYIDPVAGVAPVPGTLISANVFSSPDTRYQVTSSIDNLHQNTTFTVNLVNPAGTSTQLLSTGTLPITAHSGFSPDSDRLVISFVDSSSGDFDVTVYDLTVNPARMVVHSTLSNGGSRLEFSPSGRYFLTTTLHGASQAEVQIYRVQGVTTQTSVFDSGNYGFAVGSGEDGQTGTWGFSPDTPETSFVYAFVGSQTTVQWNLVNLAAGQQVKSVPFNNTLSIWKYNPCGDVIGVISQPGDEGIDLYLTRDGSPLFPSSTFAIASTTLSSTGTQEVVQFNADPTTFVLAASPSCGPNTPTGSNVITSPKDPASGASPITVTFSNVTQAGQTTVTSSTTGTPPPAGFMLGTPSVFYDLATTAIFSGQIQVCVSYAGVKFTGQPQLFHFESGAWVNQTVSVDAADNRVCATVTSLSPFALFESVALPLTISANNATQVYGAAAPTFAVTPSGLVNGDTLASLGGTLLCATTATQTSPVGSYPITCSGLTSATYAIAYSPGTLKITPAPLTIAANNVARPYGASNPGLPGTVTGLQNGDPITAIFTTTAGPASFVGVYPITLTVLDPSNRLSNYSLGLINGTLAVTPERTLLTVTLSPLSIMVGQSAMATVTVTAPDMVIPIDPSVLAAITLSSPVVSDILTNNGLCTPVPSAAPGAASCTFAVTSSEPNGRTLNASFPGTADLAASSGTADLIVTAALETQNSCISSDFRNVGVAGGSYLWFNSIFKVKDVTKKKITVTFFQSSVQFQYKDSSSHLVTVNQTMPDAKIVIDPSVTTASTSFDDVDNVWITTVPLDLDDAAFLTGIPWLVPAGGIPADIEPISWCGTFASDTAGVDIGWRWAAAAYSSFSSNNAVLGVKPMFADHDNPGSNHDLAGTPENFKQFVVRGARGNGGTNYTGTYSRSVIIE